MSETIYQKYVKNLNRYLLVYLLLHLVVIVSLFGFERGWWAFIYLVLFLIHLPMMLLGGIFTLIGKRKRNAYIWLTAMICFILSNGYWLHYLWHQGFDLAVQTWLLVTIFPIYCSYRLFKLAKG